MNSNYNTLYLIKKKKNKVEGNKVGSVTTYMMFNKISCKATDNRLHCHYCVNLQDRYASVS